MSALQPAADDEITTSLQLLRLVTSYQMSQVIAVAATLRLADHLAAGARSSAELALLTETHPLALYRLLRTLASCGVVQQDATDVFTLTALGDSLRVAAPHSIHALVVRHGSENFWSTWGDLLHCVQTGESAMSHLYAAPNPFNYYAQHPEVGKVMSAGFTASIRMTAYAVLAVYDFSAYGTVIDIGGGQGQLLAAILQAYPTLRGVLFDLPGVTTQQAALLGEPSIAARCTVLAGDFFVEVPIGGDIYMLSRVIHDWDDAQAGAILAQCQRALAPQAKLLLMDVVLPDLVEPSVASWERQLSDLNMLVRTGGHERTEEQFRQLLHAAGFKVSKIIPTSGPLSLIEAVHSGTM